MTLMKLTTPDGKAVFYLNPIHLVDVCLFDKDDPAFRTPGFKEARSVVSTILADSGPHYVKERIDEVLDEFEKAMRK